VVQHQNLEEAGVEIKDNRKVEVAKKVREAGWRALCHRRQRLDRDVLFQPSWSMLTNEETVLGEATG
jgi:hypothetical protein